MDEMITGRWMGDAEGAHRAIIEGIGRLERGRVWCTRCGSTQSVDSGKCMRSGWPKCCGMTMTIDSPQERKQPPAGAGGSHA